MSIFPWRSAKFTGAVLLACGLFTGCYKAPNNQAQNLPRNDSGPAEFLGSAICSSCHTSQYEKWSGSHHDLAMQHATKKSIKGDFDNVAVRVGAVESVFFVRDGRYWVKTDNGRGELADFEVKYTLGVAPLQQYLIEFSGGRLQTLPIAWDGRNESDGGQRWFHVYADESISHDDLLHWTGREQNWNYMCAECHSTNLRKNFNRDTQSFDTTWSEINVGCEGCHGPGSRHVGQVKSGTLRGTMGLLVDLDDAGRAIWQMDSDTGVAERSELRTRPPQQPEACGRCHSRRSVITADYQFGQPLLNTHMPALLDEHLYYADGQIQDEVYVWGSFVQSKMYQAGVTCTDCHDPHTATLKSASDPSQICSTCHLPSRFANRDHHNHAEEQVNCVDCHMPSRNYMVIDGRSDHSFRLPRPDLSISSGAPNACNNCHHDKEPEWADAWLKDWYGDSRTTHFAAAIHAGRNQLAGANALLASAAGVASYPGIARATSLSLLAPPLDPASAAAIRDGLNNADPLIRLGALRALQSVSSDFRLAGAQLLADPVRSVRIEAASLLSPVRSRLSQAAQAAFYAAEKEYVEAQLTIAERPEAHINLGSIYLARGAIDKAEASYLQALAMEPRAITARVNLADLYRQSNRDEGAEVLLQAGLDLNPDSSPLHHTLGLLLVRRGDSKAALVELEQAATLDPGNSRYVYVYGVALNSLGRTGDAIQTLQAARQSFPGNFDIGWGLITMLHASGRTDEAHREGLGMQTQYPDNRDITEFLRRAENP